MGEKIKRIIEDIFYTICDPKSFFIWLWFNYIINYKCANCGCRLGKYYGPPGGWEEPDGTRICNQCVTIRLRQFYRDVCWVNATKKIKED